MIQYCAFLVPKAIRQVVGFAWITRVGVAGAAHISSPAVIGAGMYRQFGARGIGFVLLNAFEVCGVMVSG
jgi:hypothetical protein